VQGTCGAPLEIGLGVTEGSTEGRDPLQEGTCGGSASPEAVHVFTSAAGGVHCLLTTGSDYDTLLYVRASSCSDGEELDCNDDSDIAGGTRSALQIDLQAGREHFVFVDGFGAFSPNAGGYVLTVSEGPCAEPPECADDWDCDGGLVCEQGECVEPPPECEVDGDCGAGLVCEQGECVEAQLCLANVDCAAGEYCIDATCVDGDMECLDDAGCPPGTLCLQGDCLAVNCRVDDDCAAQGQVCISGWCSEEEGSTCWAPDSLSVGSWVRGTLAAGNAAEHRACTEVEGPDATFRLRGWGTMCINTAGSDVDTVVWVYRNRDCDELNPTRVGCNDDNPAVTGGRQAALTFRPEGDENHWVVIDSHQGQFGDFVVRVTGGECQPQAACETHPDCRDGRRCVEGACLECAHDGHCERQYESCVDGECLIPPASSATCANPRMINRPGVYYGRNYGASLNSGYFCGRGSNEAAESVFQLDLPRGDYCLSTRGSRFDTLLYTYDEWCSSLNQLDCNSVNRAVTGEDETSALTLTIGNSPPYFAIVDGNGEDEMGFFVFEVTEGACQPR